MKKESRQFLWSFVKSITLCCIISLVVYFILLLVFSSLLSQLNENETVKNLVCVLLLQISYIIALYKFHIKYDEYTPSNTFTVKAELIRYYRNGGWIPAACYGILAVAAEVLNWVTVRNPVTFVGVLNMPIMMLDIPVLRAVLAYAFTLLVYYGLILYTRYQKWKGNR